MLSENNNPFTVFNPFAGSNPIPIHDSEEPMWEALIGKRINNT